MDTNVPIRPVEEVIQMRAGTDTILATSDQVLLLISCRGGWQPEQDPNWPTTGHV